MPKVDLNGKPICITGASSGIGRATALACARAGMPVVANARRVEKLESLKGEIEAAGGRCEIIPGDVTVQADCDAMVARCVEAFGSVYSVYANAGYGIDASVAQTTDLQAREMFEVNFFGTLNAYRPALPHMMSAGAGHIVICSSSIGKIALPGCGMYCATKAAQNHIGRAMNLELRKKGVFVSTVHPVGTKTEFFDQVKQRSTGTSTFDEHAPKWMMQSADTVANAIVRCLRRPKPEVWPTWSVLVRLAMGITTAFPALADMGTRRLAD